MPRKELLLPMTFPIFLYSFAMGFLLLLLSALDVLFFRFLSPCLLLLQLLLPFLPLQSSLRKPYFFDLLPALLFPMLLLFFLLLSILMSTRTHLFSNY